MTYLIFFAAAVCEIAGCYAVWAWWRLDKTPLWLIPGVLALIAFAWLLAQSDTAQAGRAYAAYGGIYIVSSLAWMAAVERALPRLTDYLGAGLCLAGAAVILFGAAGGGRPPL
jgi:small multidrug resistance family-3 protein